MALNYLESIRAIPSRNLVKKGAMVSGNLPCLIQKAIDSGGTRLGA